MMRNRKRGLQRKNKNFFKSKLVLNSLKSKIAFFAIVFLFAVVIVLAGMDVIDYREEIVEGVGMSSDDSRIVLIEDQPIENQINTLSNIASFPQNSAEQRLNDLENYYINNPFRIYGYNTGNTLDVLVIIDTNSYSIDRAELEKVLVYSDKSLFDITGIHTRYLGIIEKGMENYWNCKNNWIEKDCSEESIISQYIKDTNNHPEAYILFRKDEVSFDYGGYASGYLLEDENQCNEFKNASKFIFGGVIDWDHSYGRCGYIQDITTFTRTHISDFSIDGECRNQQNTLCVNYNNRFVCENLINDLDPFVRSRILYDKFFIMHTIIHEYMHHFGQNGNDDHAGTPLCQNVMQQHPEYLLQSFQDLESRYGYYDQFTICEYTYYFFINDLKNGKKCLNNIPMTALTGSPPAIIHPTGNKACNSVGLACKNIQFSNIGSPNWYDSQVTCTRNFITNRPNNNAFRAVCETIPKSSDSDGTLDPPTSSDPSLLNKGVVQAGKIYNYNYFVDVCANTNSVKEYYVTNDGRFDYKNLACPSGKICRNGKCENPASTCQDECYRSNLRRCEGSLIWWRCSSGLQNNIDGDSCIDRIYSSLPYGYSCSCSRVGCLKNLQAIWSPSGSTASSSPSDVDYICGSDHINNGDGTCTAEIKEIIEDGEIIQNLDETLTRNSNANTLEVWSAADQTESNLYGKKIVRGYIEWDTSSIPDASGIINVSFRYKGDKGMENQQKEQIKSLVQTRPSITSNQELFNFIYLEPFYYPNGGNFIIDRGENLTINLLPQAAEDMRLNLDYNWFAIGLIGLSIGNTINIPGISSSEGTFTPTLIVKYRAQIAQRAIAEPGESVSLEMKDCLECAGSTASFDIFDINDNKVTSSPLTAIFESEGYAKTSWNVPLDSSMGYYFTTSFDNVQLESNVLDVYIKCGNSIIETGEQCDDGNTNNGDGCSSNCQIETPQCASGADTDGSNIIDNTELNSYIQQYYLGNVNIDKLSNAIVEHLNGCL